MELSAKMLELIEQYLKGELVGKALHDFEQQLNSNQALAQEVAFQKEMHQFLAESPENELRKNLQLLGNQFVKSPKEEKKGLLWWLFPNTEKHSFFEWIFNNPAWHLAWLLPLALTIGWWWNQTTPVTPKNPITKQDSSKQKIELLPIDTTHLVQEEEEINQDTSQNPSNLLSPKQPIPKSNPQKSNQPAELLVQEPTNEPTPTDTTIQIYYPEEMASIPQDAPNYELSKPPIVYWNKSDNPRGDFDLSLYFGTSEVWEAKILQKETPENVQVRVLQQPIIAYLAKDTNFSYTANDLALELVFITSKQLDTAALVLYMRDNQGNPYGPFSVMNELETRNDSTYVLNTQLLTWDHTPRLAYYSIEDYKTGERYFVDKLPIIPQDSLLNKNLFPVKGPLHFVDIAGLTISDDSIDLFAPNPELEALIAQNYKHSNGKLSFSSPIPDTVYTSTIEALSTIQINLTTKDDLLKDNLRIRLLDNFNSIISISPDRLVWDNLYKRYGTDTYIFPLKISSLREEEEGLYYLKIEAYFEEDDMSKVYNVGKFIYLNDK